MGLVYNTGVLYSVIHSVGIFRMIIFIMSNIK